MVLALVRPPLLDGAPRQFRSVHAFTTTAATATARDCHHPNQPKASTATAANSTTAATATKTAATTTGKAGKAGKASKAAASKAAGAATSKAAGVLVSGAAVGRGHEQHVEVSRINAHHVYAGAKPGALANVFVRVGYANGSNSGRNYIRAELLAGSELLAAYARTAAGSKIAKYCH